MDEIEELENSDSSSLTQNNDSQPNIGKVLIFSWTFRFLSTVNYHY